MIGAPKPNGPPGPTSSLGASPAPPLSSPAPAKIARILDEDEEGFSLEYDDTAGRKNSMRLDALTYDGAIREARSYLEIREDNHDPDGDLWDVE